MERLKPDLDELLRMAETAHPHDVLRGTTVTYPKEIRTAMSTTMLVTSSMIRFDERADRLTYKNLIEMSFIYDIPLLERMQALGRIEPIDPHYFALLHSTYCHSTAVQFYTGHTVGVKEWVGGLELLFQLIKVAPGVEVQ